MNAQTNMPATLRRLSEIVDEYDQKSAGIAASMEAFKEAKTDLEMATTIGGTYASSIWAGSSPSIYESTLKSNLLKSAWLHVYRGLNLDKIAPAGDRKKFEMGFEDPAPFTLDNVAATFGTYVQDPRQHILRGLAECFCQLDPAYRSHSKVKVGVKGLPKRVIIRNVSDYGGWGTDRLQDTINALKVYMGRPHLSWPEFSSFLNAAKGGDDSEMDGLTLRRFMNGNAHLIFSPEMQLEINRALAEYYGDVLPDTPDENPKKRASTEVSKDLQFYRTPEAVVDRMIAKVEPSDGDKVLEPSCGDGAIFDGLRRYSDRTGRRISGMGVEVNSVRAEATRAKGYKVYCANFLEVQPKADFDYVFMNPPFYGKHYQKHINQARKFLKPGGQVIAILPASAKYDHGFIEEWRYGENWTDLPVGSFSESGTNINTGIAIFGPWED